MNKLLPVAAALALIGAPPAAMAATQMGEYFMLSGFGTLGAVQTNNDEGKFGKDRQSAGGATKSLDLHVDSNLGVQLTGTATSWLTGTVQVLAAKRDKSYVEPLIEWAYVSVTPLEGLTVRGGRMAAPMFAVSDFRNVGYANTWVRAPNEVYALNLFRNMKGMDVTYTHSLGSAVINATAFGGETSFKPFPTLNATGKNLKGVNLQLETDWATFRLGKATTKVVIPVIEPGDLYTFTGAGVTVDRDNIVAQAEYVTRESETKPTTINAKSWYVLGGYRFGKVLPYVIFGATKPKTKSSGEQTSTAVGLRWDAFSSAAIKFQLDRIDTHDTKGISFTTDQLMVPGPPTFGVVTKPVTVLSVALDYTF